MTQNGGSTTFVVVAFVDDNVLLLAFDFVLGVFVRFRLVVVVNAVAAAVVEFVNDAAIALASSLLLEVPDTFAVIMLFRSLWNANENAWDGTLFLVLIDAEI